MPRELEVHALSHILDVLAVKVEGAAAGEHLDALEHEDAAVVVVALLRAGGEEVVFPAREVALVCYLAPEFAETLVHISIMHEKSIGKGRKGQTNVVNLAVGGQNAAVVQ